MYEFGIIRFVESIVENFSFISIIAILYILNSFSQSFLCLKIFHKLSLQSVL